MDPMPHSPYNTAPGPRAFTGTVTNQEPFGVHTHDGPTPPIPAPANLPLYGTASIRLDLDLSVFAGQVRMFEGAAEGIVLVPHHHCISMWKGECQKVFTTDKAQWSASSESLLFDNGARLRFRLFDEDHKFLSIRGMTFSFIGIEDRAGGTPIIDLAILASLLRSQTIPSWGLYMGLIHRTTPHIWQKPT